ncbi:MAG: fibronectin type III domain-containing protein [Planctomycetes bacterium]|nr:fibronectin type III domain-containing protein [Planctomycetota bacterium]
MPTYYYRVKAYNDAGNSDYSNEANATTLLETPTGLTATAVSISQINLTWTDNSQTEDGFVIERWGSEPGEAAGFKPVATAGQNITSFTDNNLFIATHYEYRVKAYRQNNSSCSSESAGTTTPPLSVAYLTDLVTQYYQQGLITNYGVYQSMQSKLSAAQQSANAGNSTAYTNQLNALINQINAQSGNHILASAATTLNQLVQASQTPGVKIEHLAPKGRMDEPVPHTPIDYIPTGFTMTYQATFTTTPISGSYSWVISSSDTSIVTLTGPLSGPITPGTKAPTIKLYTTTTDTVNMYFTFTPTHGATISNYNAVSGVSTRFGTLVGESEIKIPLTTTATTIEGRRRASIQSEFKMGGKAIIDTTKETTIGDWKLGYLENVVSMTIRSYYRRPEPPHRMYDYIYQKPFPLLDHLSDKIPYEAPKEEDIRRPQSFSTITKQAEAKMADTPAFERPLQIEQGHLAKIEYYAAFVKWLIAKNEKTGVTEYLRWWHVILDYDVKFDETGKGTSRTKNMQISDGIGQGNWPDYPGIPKDRPPLIKDLPLQEIPKDVQDIDP